jgi:hypothetical protein
MAPSRFSVGLVMAAVVTAALGSTLNNPKVTGFYHDDAIYLTTAQALAAGDGLQLDGVPGTPAATKYPPLYPAILAIVWQFGSPFPQNLLMLKAVNAFALAAALGLTGLWLRRATDLPMAAQGAVLVLLATTPGFLSFSDVVLSEAVFMLFVAATLWAGAVSPRWTWTAAASVCAGLAFLSRSVGISLVAAVAIVAWRRSPRSAVAALTVVVTLVGPWLVWIWWAAPPMNPLLEYYVRYEASAWQVMFTDPAFAWRIVVTNAALLVRETTRVWGLGPTTVVTVAVAAIAFGGWALWRDARLTLAWWFVGLYLLIVIGHPYPFARYLAPLSPFVMLTLVAGCAAAAKRLGPVAWTPSALVFVAHVAWVLHFAYVIPTGRHGELGRVMPYRWEGFERTAAWLRENTPPDAVLASGHDQLYALYTGRRAVRPWLHPVTLTLPPAHPEPTGRWLAQQLHSLGVTHLLVDPFLLGQEGRYGTRSIESILEAEGRDWQPVYRDDEYGHLVYEYVGHD